MGSERAELLQGTLELLILKALAPGAMHGWGVSRRIAELSDEVLSINQGSLYPALQRLEAKGWVETEWGTSSNNRRAKFYRLTRTGRRRLGGQARQWDTFATAVYKILESE